MFQQKENDLTNCTPRMTYITGTTKMSKLYLQCTYTFTNNSLSLMLAIDGINKNILLSI